MQRIIHFGVGAMGAVVTAARRQLRARAPLSPQRATANVRADLEQQHVQHLQATTAIQRIARLDERHALQASAAA